jgi:type II secretory pathway component GspD/PulD (secretin)
MANYAKARKTMKTIIKSLVLSSICCAGTLLAQNNQVVAQTNEPAPANAVQAAATPTNAAAPELDAPLVQKPAPRTASEVVPFISLGGDFPLMEAITNLAQQAGISYELAPEMMTNDVPVDVLRQPIGATRFENVTYRKALETLLNQKGLVLGKRAGSDALLLGFKDSQLVPMEPEGGDLSKMAPEQNLALETVFDPNREIPLLTAIQMLGRLAKLNILIDPRIKTGGIRQVGTNIIELPAVATNTVSLSTFGGVTPLQTLDAVLNNYGLMLVSDPKTSFSQVTFRDPTAKEPVYTYTVPLHYSNTTNIATLVQVTFPNTRVQADSRTAQLVLLATQRDYDAITNLVASLDTPTREVLIEARFLETFTNPKSMKGIDWTDTLQAQRFTMGNGMLSGGTTKTTTTQSPGDSVITTLPNGTQVSTSPGSSTQTTTTDTRTSSLDSTVVSLTSGGGFAPNVAFLNAQGVNAVLSFLNSESESRVLATPRVVTLDNQETKLEVTRAIPIFNNSDAIGQAGTQISSSRPEYTNVGTILIVTPRITGTNVAMKVRPEISKVEPEPSRKVIQGKVNEADIFATSKIETQVIIPSGNTLVMGGLISDSTQKSYTKVPFLGDIPVLGYAFRKESTDRSKANLIIFVTPTIIESGDYQPYRTEFLNTKMPEHDQSLPPVSERGKPYDPEGKNAEMFRPNEFH